MSRLEVTRASPEKARKWGVAVLLLFLGAGAVILNSNAPDRDSKQMDRGISTLVEALESGKRSDFIAAQKVFLDVNSGWIVDRYAVFAIQATDRLRIRVVGPDEGERVRVDESSPYYSAIARGELREARKQAELASKRDDPEAGQRSKYMLRFVTDIERVGGEDVVEGIRGR
jgi:hypothetical protein